MATAATDAQRRFASGAKSLSGVKRVCAECGVEFVDRSRTSPRSYCEECRPRKSAPPALPSELVRVAGEPFTLEHFRSWCEELLLAGDVPFELEPWQALFVADVFAGYKECWLIVPEGNGKSTLIAVLILYCCEFAPDASIPVAAASRDQAEIIFKQATGFVRRSRQLWHRFRCKPGLREIVFQEVALAKIYASDAGTGDGIIPTPIEVLDELHRHKTLDLYRTWAGKLDKEDAQLIVISTAGAPGGEFEHVREQMRQAATKSEVGDCFGRYVGPTSVLHEYAIPEGGDVEDLDLVKKANPSVRITVETLAAKRARPSWSLGHWRRLTCNLPTRENSAAITEREWFDAATLEPAPDGSEWWMGLDVAWRWDTTAFVPFCPVAEDLRLFGPAVIVEPPRDGSSTHPNEIKRAYLDEASAGRHVTTIVMDMNRAEDLAAWFSDDLGLVVIDRAQTPKPQAEDYERFMEGLRQGWIRHSGDVGLRRHALNAVTKLLPGGGAKFGRSSETRIGGDQDARVIDALVAAAMVHSVWSERAEVWASSW